jgi:hypothetical protein
MVQRGHAIFVGRMHVRPRLQRRNKPPPLICRHRIPIATNVEKLVRHWLASVLRGQTLRFP